MSIDHAEQLKIDLTDKWVVVAEGVPELRRFAGFNGKVKTVNMNCRALVEFDGSEDIGWYDIDPGYLTVIDAPRKKEAPKAETKAEPKPATKKAAGGASPLDMIRKGGAAPAAKKAGGASPLDMIRKGGASKPAAASGEKKQSPLDQIRKSAAAPAAAPEVSAPAAEAPAPTPAEDKPTEDLSKLSPIEQIRRRGAAKS
jgi:hypothetical protein